MNALIFTEYLDALQSKLHIEKQIEAKMRFVRPQTPRGDGHTNHVRRHYHGANSGPVEIDANDAYEWIEVFENYLSSHKDVCHRVMNELEPMVNAFGFSLKHPKQFTPPEAMLNNILWIQ